MTTQAGCTGSWLGTGSVCAQCTGACCLTCSCGVTTQSGCTGTWYIQQPCGTPPCAGNVAPTVSPVNITPPSPACAGDSVSFSVTASGIPAPTYQWRRNGINLASGGPISGVQSSTLTINPVDTTHAGIYDVVVSNICGSPPNPSANLTVNPRGACCTTSGCTLACQSQCAGSWGGAGSTCDTACVGACCQPSGCTITTQPFCPPVYWQGGGTTCDVCPGACCTSPCSPCTFVPRSQCLGVFTSDRTCSPDPCCPPVPQNDSCALPETLQLNTPVFTSNVGAANEPLPPVLCPTGGQDVWYTFTANVADVYTFINGGSNGAAITLFLDCLGGPSSEVACDRRTGNQPAVVSRVMQPGETVRIRIAGFDNTASIFAVRVTGTGPVGACCKQARCFESTPSGCVGPFARFIFPPVECNAPLNLIFPCCYADFNQSNNPVEPTVQDIFDFLAAYFNGQFPDCDFNKSGNISVQDIFDYLAAYFIGCA
ncbi:MAG: immunoglobulin domain-containing protein [Phycisphaerales bacterium]|nr:immunoglobulin domain-containing protein [Phycisphaerales bacterium]